MQIIKIERSEWFIVDAEDVTFETTEDRPEIITGIEWLALSEEDRGNYIINTNQAAEKAFDGKIDYFDVCDYTNEYN